MQREKNGEMGKFGDVQQPPKEFLEKLNGWMTNQDGETLCPECWHKYIVRFDQKIRKDVRTFSRPSQNTADVYKVRDGYFVTCDGKECQKTIAAAFS